MATVLFSEEAQADALDAFSWYEGQRLGLGGQFRDALDVAVERIAEAPLSYAIQYRDLRRALVRRFPYAISTPRLVEPRVRALLPAGLSSSFP